jgi:signal peptidase I
MQEIKKEEKVTIRVSGGLFASIANWFKKITYKSITPPLDKPEEEKTESWKDILVITLISLAIIIPFRIYIAQPFIVSGPSMDNTFADGQYLIVDQISYRFENPHRGDVIIFKYPLDTTKYFIKRIVGLPGEVITVKGNTISIKNAENPKGYTLEEPYVKIDKLQPQRNDSIVDKKLGADEYFVMGDNRLVSSDSRIWGPLKRDLIAGRPILRMWPLTKIDLLPGEFTY